MKRIRVVLASEDEDYVERLLYYVRSREEGKWHFQTFSDAQLCEQFLSDTETVDLFVVEAGWEDIIQAESIRKVVLCEAKDSGSEQMLFKYQPLPNLLEALRDSAERANINEVINTDSDQTSRLVAVYSAAGGTGKTMTAWQMLKHARDKQLHTFYLNLELTPAAKALGLLPDEGDTFARLLYYLQTGSERLKEELEDSIQQHEELTFDYLPAFHHLLNRLELGSAEVETLLKLITSMRHYDLIIVDLDSIAHESTLAALRHCDRILWIVTDDIQCIEKTMTTMKELNIRDDLAEGYEEKTTFVLNKHTGSLVNDSLRPFISLELPYIPEWKTVSSITDLEDAPFYRQKLQQLMDSVIGINDRNVTVGSDYS